MLLQLSAHLLLKITVLMLTISYYFYNHVSLLAGSHFSYKCMKRLLIWLEYHFRPFKCF